jgi:hypothetical protein
VSLALLRPFFDVAPGHRADRVVRPYTWVSIPCAIHLALAVGVFILPFSAFNIHYS